MKLSVKIAGIFVVMTALTIILYVVSSNIMVNYLYQGEVARITGITSGVMNRITGETSRLISMAKDYAEMIPNIDRLAETCQLDMMDELGIYEKFEQDGIQGKVILSPEFTIDKIYLDKSKQAIDQVELDFIIQTVYERMDDKENTFDGIVSTKNNPYLISINPLINQRKQKLKGYFMVIQAIDHEMIQKISRSMQKNIELVSSVDGQQVSRVVKSEYGQDIQLIYGENTISSYYPIENQEGQNKFYITIKEPLVVKESTKRNIQILAGILIIVCILTNYILCILIGKIVVKRIIKLNKQINYINNAKDLSERILTDHSNDEIGILEEDINKMFNSIEIANEHIEVNETKYSSVLQAMTNGFAYYQIKKDQSGKYIDAVCEEFNDEAADILDVPKEQMLGRKFSQLFEGGCITPVQLQEILGQLWRTDRPYTLNEVRLREDRWVDLTLHVIEGDYLAVIVNDVTTLKSYSEEMKYLAEYDSLTMLKNRHSLYQYLGKLKRTNKHFVIYFMDLDNFKTLNDTVGHMEGDKVLRLIADELVGIADNQTTVGRLGGDEFIVIKEGDFISQEVMQFGQKILGVINKKFEYAFYNFTIKASIGVSIYPQQTTDIDTLFKYGDIAMYKSKKNGGNSIQIFTDEMMEEIELEVSLKDAIDNGGFIPYYQPVFDLKQNKIIGAEVLARWIRNGAVIPPSKFIPIAKRIGHIVEIDYMILDKGCKFCKKWHDSGVTDFEVSVNFSYRSLRRPNCIESIKKIINRYNIDPSVIRIEITEDEVVDYPEYIIKILNEIKKIGIKVVLDDFGVGYSSFNYIKILPIDILKIDRSLLLKIEEDEKTVVIIDTIIKLAHALGLDVVCEGVDEETQLELLKKIKCDKIQGYYISQPVEEVLFYKCIEHYDIEAIEKEAVI